LSRPLRITVDVRELKELADEIPGRIAAIEASIVTDVMFTLTAGQTKARSEVPKFMNTLGSSITITGPIVTATEDMTVIAGQIKTGDMAWAVVQEDGRRPGSGPPIEAMRRYIKTKYSRGQWTLFDSGRGVEHDILRAAIGLSAAIRDSGSTSFRYMGQAADEAEETLLKRLVLTAETWALAFEGGV
jgi:hypothetical protein